MREEDPGSAQALTDAELAVQFQAGDAVALGYLYDRHVRGIHDFLVRFTRDPSAAEDLTHSTFLRAWERRGALRDPSRVRAWLYAMAHNLALNHLTRLPPAGSTDEAAAERIADATRGPEEQVMTQEVTDLVWAAASSLEARQYAVLDLSVRHELSTREVADVLGVSVGHAAVLVNRAREALGNAVRFLLVARRREQCERLAALVPAGVRALTVQQRRAVDHHVRRCEVCQDLGRRLTSPAQLFGALLPLPVPDALGHAGRDRLVAAVQAQPAASAPSGPSWPPRHPWTTPPRWAVAAGCSVLLLALGGGMAIHLLRPPAPHPVHRRPGVSAGRPAPGLAPSPSAPAGTPAAGESPSTPGTPQPALAATIATPARQPAPVAPVSSAPPPAAAPPVAAPAPPPTPTPQPPMSVAGVGVRGPGPLSCPLDGLLNLRLFVCSFTVTVQVANANGGEVVQGTLTARSATSGEVRSASFQLRVPAAGGSSVSAAVTLSFSGCVQGTASATTLPASAAPSNAAPFGTC